MSASAVAAVSAVAAILVLAWTFNHLSHLLTPGSFDDSTEKLTLDEFLSCSKTGDLVLFSGTGRDSAVVRAWSGCRWSHVGMVVKDGDDGENVYLWNADACVSRRNMKTKKFKEGVQLNDMILFLETFPGHVYHCPLLRIFDADDDTGFDKARLFSMIRALDGKKFNHNILDLLRCTLGGSRMERKRSQIQPVEDVDLWFCSQLIAWAYQELGILGQGIAPAHYHPSSFIGELPADWTYGYGPGPLREILRFPSTF